MLIDRSNSISSLANSFMSIQKTKLDIVKELNKNGKRMHMKVIWE